MKRRLSHKCIWYLEFKCMGLINNFLNRKQQKEQLSKIGEIKPQTVVVTPKHGK